MSMGPIGANAYESFGVLYTQMYMQTKSKLPKKFTISDSNNHEIKLTAEQALEQIQNLYKQLTPELRNLQQEKYIALLENIRKMSKSKHLKKMIKDTEKQIVSINEQFVKIHPQSSEPSPPVAAHSKGVFAKLLGKAPKPPPIDTLSLVGAIPIPAPKDEEDSPINLIFGGFKPKKPLSKEDKRLLTEAFLYDEKITSNKALAILENYEAGTYLIRESNRFPGNLVLSFFDKNNIFTEVWIQPKKLGGFSLLQILPDVKNGATPGSFTPNTDIQHLSDLFSLPFLKEQLKTAAPINEQSQYLEKAKITSRRIVGSQHVNTALQILNGEKPGTYFIRRSSDQKDIVIVLKKESGSLQQFKLIKQPGLPSRYFMGRKSYPDIQSFLAGFPREFKMPLNAPSLMEKEAKIQGGSNYFAGPSPVVGPKALKNPPPPNFAPNFPAWPNKTLEEKQLQLYSDKPLEMLKLSRQGVQLPPDVAAKAALQLTDEITKIELVSLEKIAAFYALSDIAAEGYQLENKPTQAIAVRALAARYVQTSPSSPLYHLDKYVQENSALQKNPQFGAFASHLDTGAVRNGQIKIHRRIVDGKDQHHIKFRLNEHARFNLQKNLLLIQDHLPTFVENLPPNLKGDVKISEIDDVFLGKESKTPGAFSEDRGYLPTDAKAIKVEFPGVGAVIIGNSPTYGGMYQSVRVIIDANLPPGESANRAQAMLLAIGVGPALHPQSADDLEKIKIAKIFRAYDPGNANQMERSKEFYGLSSQDLKQLIIQHYPHMKEIFERYDRNPSLCQEVELMPGSKSWALMDIGTQMRQKGAIGLMQGVGSPDAVALILQSGSLSGQDRFDAGLYIPGVSAEDDLQTGGGDRVFTRLINKETINFSLNNEEFPFQGHYQILYDLDITNVSGYGYNYDQFGVKSPFHPTYGKYRNRESLISFAENADSGSNEVMLRSYIPPSYMRGVVCQSPTTKTQLIDQLRQMDLLQKRGGKEYIKGVNKTVDEFIHVAQHFDEKMWK